MAQTHFAFRVCRLSALSAKFGSDARRVPPTNPGSMPWPWEHGRDTVPDLEQIPMDFHRSTQIDPVGFLPFKSGINTVPKGSPTRPIQEPLAFQLVGNDPPDLEVLVAAFTRARSLSKLA